jgi:RasGEF domain
MTTITSQVSVLNVRVDALARFIKIAYHCLMLQNFNTAYAMTAALHDSCVQRLKLTWSKYVCHGLQMCRSPSLSVGCPFLPSAHTLSRGLLPLAFLSRGRGMCFSRESWSHVGVSLSVCACLYSCMYVCMRIYIYICVCDSSFAVVLGMQAAEENSCTLRCSLRGVRHLGEPQELPHCLAGCALLWARHCSLSRSVPQVSAHPRRDQSHGGSTHGAHQFPWHVECVLSWFACVLRECDCLFIGNCTSQLCYLLISVLPSP